MNSSNPFETFEKYAFRLEALPQYLVVDEKEAFDTFKKTGNVQSSDSDWLDTVRQNTTRGKNMDRLRLFSEKLSDYERFETQRYAGPKGGERIRTALRKDNADNYKYDFWFFDDKWIAQINYEEDGTFVNFDIREATAEEFEMYQYWRSVFETAKPLRQVPFISNTPDDTHCLQAAYMSIAKYFDPEFSIEMDEWSEITGYEEGLGTWGNAGLVWFKENGYDVRHYELFDYEEFIKRPKEYMIEVHGKEAGTWGYEHTNVPAETERMRRLVAAEIPEKREATLEDIKSFIDEGYLIRVTVNYKVFNSEEGYVGHAIVVTSYNDTYIQFHDPGLPAVANRQVTYEEFEAAWSDQERELDAIRN